MYIADIAIVPVAELCPGDGVHRGQAPVSLVEMCVLSLNRPEAPGRTGHAVAPARAGDGPHAQAIDPLCRVSSSARTGTPRRVLDVDRRRGRMSGACSSRPRTRMRRARARIANVPSTSVTSAALGADVHTEDGRHHDIAQWWLHPRLRWRTGLGARASEYECTMRKGTKGPRVRSVRVVASGCVVTSSPAVCDPWGPGAGQGAVTRCDGSRRSNDRRVEW